MKIRGLIKNRAVKNASWIIVCKVVQSILSFFISMLTARYLGPSNFGLINYAISIIAFLTPITELGLSSTLVQELVTNESEDEGTIMGTAMLMSIVSAVLCMIGAISFVLIANAGEKDTIIVCSLYSIVLFFQALELIRFWYQAKYLAKYTSIISLIAYTFVSVYKFYLLATGKSVYWFAIANAIDYMIIAVSLIILFKKKTAFHFSFSYELGRKMLAKSHHYILSSLMVTIFAQTDKIMIKNMIDDTNVGLYSAAVTCAGLTSFVFSAICESARPIVFSSFNENNEEFEKQITRLYSIIIYLSLFQSVFMTVFSRFIIRIIYGTAFLVAGDVLKIIVWYTTFSYIGVVRNIWILANGLQKFLWKINLCGALANVILNSLLIPHFGIFGAAVASLITQFFTNVIMGYIIKPLRTNNKLMVCSLNPRILISLIK